MENEITARIRLWGIVQGVGFRPFVAKLADRLSIKGEVRNIGGLVDIIITDTHERIEGFITALQREKPLPAEIVHIKKERLPLRRFDDFAISGSDEGDDEAAMIPADLSICPDCLAEMLDSGNPRFFHPFISCMACGPRYSIIDKIPYDRKNTAMTEFDMCSFCNGEYTNLKDRRFHAQTISCHDCGPVLLVRTNSDAEDEVLPFDMPGMPEGINRKIRDKAIRPIVLACSLIKQGKIIAVKSVGGYNFVCSPFDSVAVKNLRKLKIREEKPFAIMFRDINQIKDYCYVDAEEEKLLLSNAKPIVLLERKNTNQQKKICEEVYRSSRYTGAFLPSMGLQYMLTDLCGPLIMTSANLSDMPVIKDDEEILSIDNPLLSAVFYNERKIRIRLDDSVARIIDGQPQMIRRSKGYAPMPLYIRREAGDSGKDDMIFAAGGQLKSSFCLTKGPFAYISQYFGDLDSREACDIYRENVLRMEKLLRIKPGLIVCDLHPLYFTTAFSEEYIKTHNTGRQISLLRVQHHHAHSASVMAEHGLSDPVIGVSMDGTGFGTDNTVWGGEFLICESDDFRRAGHLEAVPMLGGDSSMKEGWKSAMCFIDFYDRTKRNQYLQNSAIALDSRYLTVKSALRNNINTIMNSSMGRLFDAVSAFLGIQDINRYEGECAIMLENSAVLALKTGLPPCPMDFMYSLTDNEHTASAEPLFNAMQEAMSKGIAKEAISLGFHYAVSGMINKICRRIREDTGINQAVLSGGVFQNKVLMDSVLKELRSGGFEVYYNVSVSPNDGGICLGQAYLGMEYLKKNKRSQ